MKTLNKYPSDQNVLCPKYIFYPVGRDSFYVYSNYLLAIDHVIVIGKEYVLFDNTDDTNKKMSEVRLTDCRYHRGIISLIVRDLKSKRVFTVQHRIECPESSSSWFLIDSNFFFDKENSQAIQSYCNGCNDSMKKTNTNINHKSNQDDLLDFED